MNCTHINFAMNRRDFFGRFALGIGGAALSGLLKSEAFAAPARTASPFRGTLDAPHFAPKAKRIIYLFMSGGPSQVDLFDYKPLLNRMNGQDLPASVRMGQRLTGMTGYQATLPLAGSIFPFAQQGRSGAWVSELLPWTAKMVDELCFVKSLHTEAINHDPAITFFQTGAQLAGRPSMGAWLSYGLGSANENLPAFVDGISRESRRKMLDRLAELQALQFEDLGDPEINSRVAQYEMAYRMQTSVPEVLDISQEPEQVFELYGAEAKNPGTFAANCLLARRLAERNVRFIQLYHPGWDHHGGLPNGIRRQCKDVDQAGYALITDLKQRGLLDDTLVVWGGEFGRTNYSQGKLTATDYGRDHHPRCFTAWLAGGGVKPGACYGATDEYGYNIVRDPVHVHDLQATILHLLGIDHEKLTYKFQGRYYRLTDVHGDVVQGILA